MGFGLFRQLRGYSSNPKYNSKMSFWRLWTDYFLQMSATGYSQAFKVRAHNQYSDGGALYSGRDRVSVFYTIDGYSNQLPRDMKALLRDTIPNGSNIRLSFIDLYETTDIDWSSAAVKARMNTYRVLEEETERDSAYGSRETMIANKTIDQRSSSITYLKEASYANKQLFIIRTMMIISGDRGEIFDDTVRAIVSKCTRTLGLSVTRVTEDLDKYMAVYSPFSMERSADIERRVGNYQLTDEILGQLYSYSQGKVGYQGIYMGTDLKSGFPIIKALKQKETDNEAMLITGRAGSGKSFVAKAIVLQIIADPRFNVTIMDYEGDEYRPLYKKLRNTCFGPRDVITLNMAEGQGSYLDPVAICIPNGTDYNVEENNPYNMAINYARAILITLCGKAGIDNELIGLIINDAITQTYVKAGVVMNNPRTWRLSSRLTLNDVYESILSISRDSRVAFNKEQAGQPLTIKEDKLASKKYRDALEDMVLMLSDYFGANPSKGYIFADPINLNEVIGAKVVICSFGMKGRNVEEVDQIQGALMQSFAANVSHIRSIYSKANGKLNCKVWEEFQRFSAFEGSIQTIKTALTGGRKLGDVNIIITNSVEDILDDDKYAILATINTACIGMLSNSATRDKICDRLELNEMRGALDDIANAKKNQGTSTKKDAKKRETGTSEYEHAFLISLDNSVTTVGKMLLPPAMIKSKIFKTGVDVKAKESSEERGVSYF